jgi:DNA-binding transcriptional LysR family regulator
MMNDRLSGIAAFVRAADAASFAVAAEQMGLSRSAVGKAVARLEERLGVQLFHRTTRSLSLTDEGAMFYERCSGALADITAAEQSFEAAKREPAGRIRISVPVLLGRHCIAPILVDLARVHAQLEIDLAFTDRPVDLLDDGVDLVVRTGALADDGDLKARLLGLQTMVLCASPSYLQIHGAPRALCDLASHDALAYGRGNSIVPWHFIDQQGREHAVKPRGRIRFDDLEAIVDAAAGGNGLAWLPSWLIAPQLNAGLLIEVLPEMRGRGYDIYAVWPLGRYLPTRVRVVIDELVTKIPLVPGLA